MKTWLEILPDLEGRFNFLYPDVNGIPTIGTGHAVMTAADAVALFGAEMAAKDWQTIKNAAPGLKTALYAPMTLCRLTDEQIAVLLAQDTDEAERKLKAICQDSGEWPAEIRMACADIVFNTGSLKFPSMLAAIRAGDYATAAKESHRAGIQDSRNNWTRDMILTADRASHAVDSADTAAG